ncbi:MAG: PLDc N-terminal domain-containing protein [Candidatus Rifleibacteriota bacterium]
MWAFILGISFLGQTAAAGYILYTLENKKWELWNTTLSFAPLTYGQLAMGIFLGITILFLLHVIFNRKFSVGRKIVWFVICSLVPVFGNFGYWKTIATGQDAYMIDCENSSKNSNSQAQNEKNNSYNGAGNQS